MNLKCGLYWRCDRCYETKSSEEIFEIFDIFQASVCWEMSSITTSKTQPPSPQGKTPLNGVSIQAPG